MPEGSRAAFVDLAPVEQDFREAALAGLQRREKSIPCRFLYDEKGSALFEAICDLPEYYLTRTEIGILEARAGEIAAMIGPHCQLIEFGSGSSRKVRILLAALQAPRAYIAIDVSRELLREATERIAADFPKLDTVAVCADFTTPHRLPALPAAPGVKRVGFFPGSTVGNLEPGEVISFLSACRDVVGSGGGMLIGVDLKKDPTVLHDAYNDAAGVTAAFILNLLERMNRELGANFDATRFRYEAFYSREAGRVELYIQSLADQIVTVAGTPISFVRGERIHAEYSYKYAIDEFHALAERAGFHPRMHWTDRDSLFSVHYLHVE